MLNPIEEIKNKIDIVELIGSYIKLQKAGANYRALCPFHSEKKPSFFVSPSRQMWHCFGCFLPGSLIKTEKGFHKIENLQVGDLVLTHKGRYMPVFRTLWRPYKGEIVDIRVRKSNQVISLTADHNVYVIKTKYCKYKSRKTRICNWNCKKSCPAKFYKNYKIEIVPAGQLKKDDYLLYPVNQEVRDVEFIDLDKYYNRRITNYGPDIRKIPTKIKIDEKFLKLIGYYVAEGSNHRAYIRFSLGNNEVDFAKEIQRLIKEIFGIKAAIYKRKGKRTGIEISACNSKLSNVFENLCGLHAEHKHIPYEFQYLPPKKQRIILDAIYKGDGYSGKVSKCKKNRRYKAITTTSLVLAEQLRDILLRLGKSPGFYVQKEKVDKDNVHHKKSFKIIWEEDYILNFSRFYHDPEEKTLYFISPIKEIKKRQYQGDTFDLTISGDHSYVATNFVVSNCGRGGDVFKFIMEMEGVEFGDALRILAQKAGVELKEYRPEWRTKRKKLYEISELAAKFFQKQLKASPTGKKVKDYLLSRGISEESIEKWRLGWAPDQWHALFDFLISRGYQEENIRKAGLIVKNEKREVYDRFRSRIIFPIFDFNSQVIGFGGRIFGKREEKEVAKYINTPATPIYDKSKVLYGLDKAKLEIRKKDFSIVVEGYVDVILVSQTVFSNVVGVSGTALTPYHLRNLKRYTNHLYLSFDMDVGGETATKRGIDLAQRLGFDIKIITMPQGEDPADIVKEDPKKWEKLVEGAKNIMDFYFDNAFSQFDKETPEGKKKIASILLPPIKRIPNKIVQAHWIQKLAGDLRVKEGDIREELKKIKENKMVENLPPLGEEPSVSKTRKEMLEERVLALLIKKPELLKYMKEDFEPYFSERSLKVISVLRKALEKAMGGETYKKENLIKKIDEVQKEYGFEDSEFLNYLILKSDVEFAEGKDLEKEAEICIRELRSYAVRKGLSSLANEIEAAKKEKDSQKVNELLKKFNNLSKELLKYQNINIKYGKNKKEEENKKNS